MKTFSKQVVLQFVVFRAFWIMITLPLISAAALAEYRLAPGDVIEVSVAGVADLRQRATVGMYGEVVLPIIGQVNAAGRSLTNLRRTVQKLFAEKMLRRFGRDGHDSPSIVLPEAVTLTIVEYRPVYVNGDVGTPGEVVFRPGLTVRKAIALSGGYGMRMTNTVFMAADALSDYENLWVQIAREQILIRRIEAELDGKTTMDRSNLLVTPVKPSLKTKIEALEAEQLTARIAQFKREKSTLDAGIKRANAQLSFLEEVEENDKKAMTITAGEVERLELLHKKGLTPIAKVSQARRDALLQSTRQLQTMGQRSLVERDRVELTLRLEKVDGQRKTELLLERQEAEIRLANVRARLKAASEKLARSGEIADHSDPPKIEIVRKTKVGHRRFAAEEDTELLPGDVVEVASQKQSVPAEVLGQ